MSTDFDNIEVKNNPEQHRYEIEVNGHLAELVYSRRGNSITYMHTGVPRELEGHGIANRLAHAALEDARRQKLTVYPACPFVSAYIRKHNEYIALLSESDKKHFTNE